MSRSQSTIIGLVGSALALTLGLGCSVLTYSAALTGDELRADAEAGAPPADDGGDAADVEIDDGSSGGGLIVHWAFEETSGGLARDSSGNGNDGALAGGATFTPSCGVRDGCVTLTPGPGIEVVALHGAGFPRSGTFSIWFRWTNMPQSDQHGLLDGWDDKRNHVVLRHPNDAPPGEIQAHLDSTTFQSGYVWVTTFETTANQWTHAVLTWDEEARETALYVDGVLVRRAAYAAYFVPTEQLFRIGAGFDGQIDEVRLYDRALGPYEAANVP